MVPRTLLDLPNELLLQLPAHLHNIEDFNNVASTCRRFRSLFEKTLPKTILQLAAASAPTFFSPHPYFLVLSVARQIGTWTCAIESEREVRTARLIQAFRGGMSGLLELALDDSVEGVGLTMSDIRKMHLLRFSVINPLDTTIDAMIGHAWYAQPNFWNGGAEDAFTLDADVATATMQLLIYAELFGPTMSQFLLPVSQRKQALGPDVRIEYIKYCIPDWVCRTPVGRNDGFEVEPVGPYAPDPEDADKALLQGNQTALAHMLGGAMFDGMLWKRAWRRVLIAAGAERNEDGKWPKELIERLQKITWRRRRGNPKSLDDNDKADLDEGEGEDEGDNEDEDEDDVNQETSTSNPAPEPDADQPSSRTDDWRFTLFWNALTTASDISTFAMVAQFKGREEGRDVVMKLDWKTKIVDLRDRVLALTDEDEPGIKSYGKNKYKLKVSEAPDLAAEVYWCCAGMWSGF